MLFYCCFVAVYLLLLLFCCYCCCFVFIHVLFFCCLVVLLSCFRSFVLVIVLVVSLPNNTPTNKKEKKENNKNPCFIVFFLALCPWQGFAQREANNPKRQKQQKVCFFLSNRTLLKFRRVTIRGAQPSARLSEEICLSQGSAGVSQRALRGLSEGSAGSLRGLCGVSAGVRRIF